MEENPARRSYILVLVLVAAGVLAAGVLMRPRHAPPPPVSESEALRLQMLAQQRELERRELFFSSKARALVAALEQARSRPGSVPATIPKPGERAIIVAAGANGEPLWIDTAVAGQVTAQCNGVSEREIAVSSVLPESLSAGGAFNLAGELIGLVTLCGGRNVIVTPEAIPRQAELLKQRGLRESSGLRVRTENGAVRVVEVAQTGLCSVAGVRPGDVITHVGDVAISSAEQLAAVAESPECDVRVRRDGKPNVHLRAATGRSGVTWQERARPAQVVRLAPNSPAASWGLQRGDIVLQVGERRSPTIDWVERFLTGDEQSSLIVQRGSSEVLLERSK